MPTDATSSDGARVVLITGAGRGLGAEYAHLFAADGHPVVVTDLDDETARATAEAIVAGGGQAVGLQLDVTDEASADGALRSATESFGAVDILINNAGIWGDYEMQGCLSQDLDKLGLHQLTHQIAAEVRDHGITANVVAPGKC